MEEKYYHFRDQKNRPVITVCLLKIGDQIARGIAICSDLDNPCAKIGREITKGRAIKAMVAEKSSRKMRRREVQIKWQTYSADFNTISKATYAPILTEFEQKLLKKPVKKIYEQQGIAGFPVEKGELLYDSDGILCGVTCKLPQTKGKIQIERGEFTEAERSVIFNEIKVRNMGSKSQIDDKIKIQIEDPPVGIRVDSETAYDIPHRLLNEIRELRQRMHELEKDQSIRNSLQNKGLLRMDN